MSDTVVFPLSETGVADAGSVIVSDAFFVGEFQGFSDSLPEIGGGNFYELGLGMGDEKSCHYQENEQTGKRESENF